MQTIDYLKVLEPDHVAHSGFDIASVRDVYEGRTGIAYDYAIEGGHAVQELVWFENNLLLLFGSLAPFAGSTQHQVVSDGDWIHIQFQLEGTGQEAVGNLAPTETAAHRWLVSRYPCGSTITRQCWQSPHWRAACLYFRPSLLQHLLADDMLALQDLSWLLDPAIHDARSAEFSLGAREQLVINDLFSCDFTGRLRHTYMNAKALELLTLAIAHLRDKSRGSALRLNAADRRRIEAARAILIEEIDQPLTLSQLARRVGVNRSKLAIGFRSIFGTTVQACSRELRLCKAKELLMMGQLSVTDVAAAVGYADTSCLTRAFEKRFGVLPKDCKGHRIFN